MPITFSWKSTMKRFQPSPSHLLAVIISLVLGVHCLPLHLKDAESSSELTRNKRNALRDPRYHWPHGVVPYEIDLSTYAPGHVATIMSAFHEFHMKTCLKFRPRRRGDEDFIYITSERSGCWTTVGMRGGEQVVNLNIRDNCVTFGRILHELMHVLGFYHQHSASNRDNYVEVLWANVLKGKEYNFLRYNDSEVTDFGVPYDYNSVLHYPAEAASSNKSPTLVTLKKNVHIGQRTRLSNGDVTKLNRMYRRQCSYRANHVDRPSKDSHTEVVQHKGPIKSDGRLRGSIIKARLRNGIHAPLIRHAEKLKPALLVAPTTLLPSAQQHHPTSLLTSPTQNKLSPPHNPATHGLTTTDQDGASNRIDGSYPTANGTSNQMQLSWATILAHSILFAVRVAIKLFS